MTVLVDTSVWIEYLERNNPLVEDKMDDLLLRGEVVSAGLVLAELRQGCTTKVQLQAMIDAMRPLPYLEVNRDDWLRAGEIAAEGARRGHRLAVGDCLLAALALREKCTMFTLDRDFEHIPGLVLYRPKPS